MSTSSRALPRAKRLVTRRILNHLKSTESVTRIKQLHAHVITSGVVSSRLSSNLSRSYALTGHVEYARKLFDELPDRSSALHNAVMRMYVQKGLHHDALRLFRDMIADGKSKPDDYTFPFSIKACGELGFFGAGAAVHGRALATGCASDAFVSNSLLAMYMNCRDVKSARKVFDEMPERGVVSWNTMILGCFRNGSAEEAVRLFKTMTADEGLDPDSATAVAVLPACGAMRNLAAGREVHALVEEKGLGKNVKSRNALINMYARCGEMGEAWAVFDGMAAADRDVVAWTSMIDGYIMNGDETSAIGLCGLMQYSGVSPNSVTLSLLLSACGSSSLLGPGRVLHCLALRRSLECDVYVETALIDMYAKCDRADRSLRVFAGSSKRKNAPWSAVIAGCTRNGLAREAIGLFKRMLRGAVGPTDATLSGLLNSYAVLADLGQATGIHGYAIRSGTVLTVEVATGLVDVYSKCGSMESARKAFDEIPERNKDVLAWGTVIACYARHGRGEAAVKLFNRMVRSGVNPNEVTLTSVLHACSHAGLVDEGLRLFNSMLESERVDLVADHYTCIVDLLGRAGRLEEAHEIIQGMGFRPNHAVWGALLGACVTHENVELGEIAAKWLFKLEPENTGNYVLMAKIYAAVGRWDDAENVRRLMGGIGLRKSPAHSLIEVRAI